MDHEIDSLSLKIDVELNDKDLIKVSKFSTAIQKLQISIQKLNLDKLSELEVPKGLKNLQIVTQNFRAIENENQTQNLFAGVDQKAISEITTGVEAVNDGFKEQAAIMEDITPELKQVMDGYAKLFTQIFSSRKKDPTPLDKLSKGLKRIRLIAAIKAIRGAINFLVSGLNQGVSNLASFDNEFNKTVSSIKASLTTTFNSLALIARPLIESIQPVLVSFSTAIANIANEASKIQATLKGQTTYTKINANYAEDYAKSLQKASAFSFDTFNTLSSQSSGYETVSLDEEEAVDNSTLEDAKTLIEGIQSAISGIGKLLGGVFKVVVDVIDYLKPALGVVFDIIGQVADLVGEILGNVMDALAPALSNIAEVINVGLIGFNALFKPFLADLKNALTVVTDIIAVLADIISLDFSDLGTHLKRLGYDILKWFASGIDGIINGMIDVINDFLFSGINQIGELFGWEKVGIFLGRSNLASLVPSYENGGLVGELWQMNEYGVPEMLYNANNSSNNTSVINQAQLSQAFENAIYNTGLISTIQSAGVVSIDGRDIASSTRFINEMNRRNKTNFR